MTIQLDTQARVTVDNSGAVGPLKNTQAATRDLAQEMGRAGAAGTSSGKQIAAAAREAEQAQTAAARAVAAARREEERATQAAIRAIQLFGAEARAANQAAATSARQARTTYQQLGFQISDVAAQAAVGTNPMIIFAQQGGQIAQALAGAGGVIGRVAGFLAGPWGAAVLGAGAVLGVLASQMDDAGSAADSLAERYGEAGAQIETSLSTIGRAVEGLQGAAVSTLSFFLDSLVTFGGNLATIFNKIVEVDQRIAGIATRAFQRLMGSDVPLLNPSQAAARREEDARRAAAARLDRSLESQSLVNFPQFTFGTPQAKEAQRQREAAEREARRAGDTAEREAKRAADAAAREAERFAAEQAKLIDGLASVARRTIAEIAKVAQADPIRTLREAAEQAARDAAARQADSDFVRSESYGQAIAARDAAGAEAMRLRNAEAEGRAIGSAANQELLRTAGSVGQAIGGKAGSAIEAATGVLEGLKNGDFRGVPGRVGGVLSLAGSSLGEDGWQRVTAKLDEVFGGSSGDGTFIKKASSVLAGAAIGAGVASITGNGSKESQLGGAAGGAIGKQVGEAVAGSLGKLGAIAGPLGAIAGGILGSALGGLLATTKTGSVSISGAAGAISQGGAVGNGGVQRQNAGILGNDFTNSLSQIVDRLGGTIGTFAVSIGQSNGNFRVDTTGQGRTNKKNAGVLAFGEDSASAVQAALADAIRDGAVAGVSPRVQAVLRQYADNLDRAVAEALKVQDLERLLENRANPFASVFRDFERQAADRLKIARQYGFDVVEIERVNAEERAKLLKEQLAETTASAKALLDDLRFGSRSEGSVSQRLAALGSERSRLEGLVAGGDTTQIDALSQVIQQQLDLSREAFGSTGQFAADRSGAISSLETLIRQTEDRINAASAEAQTVDKLTELNTTADEQMTELQRQTALLQQLTQGGSLAAFNIGAFARANA